MTLEQQLVYARLTDNVAEVKQLRNLIEAWRKVREQQLKNFYIEKYGIIL